MSKTLWTKLGFKENPYDTKPLKVNNEDVDLLMGRESEQVDFLTEIEASSDGVFVLSGVPGVGKTSFLNIQQYLIENGQSYGGKLLSARILCPVQPSDEKKDIAIRCIQSYTKSIQEYCDENGKKLPKQVQKAIDWVHQNKPSAFEFGISILGNGINYGKEVNLPSIKDATFETLAELIKTLSLEVKSELQFEGSFIVLDNLENLHPEDLSDILITFRDTLFTTTNIWWVLIGQSGLYSLIQSTNPKVAQRISGSLELKPITVENLIKAVNIRVQKFHTSQSEGQSLISEEVYLKLFKCSNGEIRFVFDYCSQICVEFVQTVRKFMTLEKLKMDDASFDKFIGKYITKKEINNDFALLCLKNIITEEFEGLYLTNVEKAVLKKIGELSKVKPSDFKEFKSCGVETLQQFTTKYLLKLADQNLLQRRQEGKNVTYELRGIASLSSEYELLIS
jgi:predicted CopG family antitoxin